MPPFETRVGSKPTSGRSMVINVEYNQLDPLLRATGHPDGDVNNETGYSPFPGNINQVKSDTWICLMHKILEDCGHRMSY